MSDPGSNKPPASSILRQEELPCDRLDLTFLLDAHYRAFRDQKYSDLTIICGNEEFKVHRVLVCMRSPFFAAACDGNFMESQTGIVTLKEDDLETVKRMISYFYTLDYDDFPNRSSPTIKTSHLGSTPPQQGSQFCSPKMIFERKFPPQPNKEILQAQIINNISVYSIAEKYGILELKLLARSKIVTLTNSSGEGYLPNFATILREILETTSQEKGDFCLDLWHIAGHLCVRNSKDVLKDKECRSIIEEFPGFALTLLEVVDTVKMRVQVQRWLSWENKHLRSENERLKAEVDALRAAQVGQVPE